jgi:leucyl-tRNA synthetase
MSYNPSDMESKWQQYWDEQSLYQAKDDDPRPKYYALDMFPYPSGDLHIGHWYAFTPPDMHARYQRMRGKNVMHPIGFDAFGLPAENAAIKRGLDPNDWTQQNIASMLKQFALTGIGFDMSRVVNTSDPGYYKWTQWMFLKLYEKGLAYRKKASVNWCEHDQTVLANEQVINGLCWRCDNPVVQKDLEQWFFKITDYAEQLLNDLDSLDWPETTKQMQRNWIGKSVGATVKFKVLLADDDSNRQDGFISVFTTRPDTLFGVTYIVLAPEHPLVMKVVTPENKKVVDDYINQAKHRTERDRLSTADLKTGVNTGGRAIHPLTGQEVPIWVADYVLGSYGTGAVMGVPAHDERDQQFATKHALPIVSVIEQNHSGQEVLINSQDFNGLTPEQAKNSIVNQLKSKQAGERTTTYRLRDWLVARQRYWGPPVPMIHCQKCGWVPVPETDLPVVLPEDVDFLPKGQAPLETNAAFMNTICPHCQGHAQRSAETLDTFVDSSWYFLRYADPHNQDQAFDPVKIKQWLPVDIYVGGAEHTVLHLLYSRFFTKALRDMGYLSIDEPFMKLRHQGMILGPDHQKMSKSKGNVVNPDDLVAQFGADAVRMQLAFLGPYDQGGPWQLTGIHGVARFLQRIRQEQEKRGSNWPIDSDADLHQSLAKGIGKIGGDIEEFKFNTAIAELMKINNSVKKAENINKADWEALIITLAPFAPYLAEDLWHSLGHSDSVHIQKWPELEIAQTNVIEEIAISVQINGKHRGIVNADHRASQADVTQLALELPVIKKYIDNAKVSKYIYIPGKVLNLIIE